MLFTLMTIAFTSLVLVHGQDKDGAWNEWSKWAPCTKTCGGGERMKFRRCNNPPPYNDGLECLTKQGNRTSYEEEKVQCNTNTCEASCTDKGDENECKDWKKGNLCDAQSSHHQQMMKLCKKTCAFCGSWSNWGKYTVCSITCGGKGIRERFRKCNNTASSARTLYCLTKNHTMGLADKEVVNCDRIKECPVGVWKAWSEWAECDCGKRVEPVSRHRQCNNSFPKELKCISKNGKREDYEEDRRSCAETTCPGGESGGTSQAYVIGAVVAGAVILLLLFLVVVFYLKKRRKSPQEDTLTACNTEDDLEEQTEDLYSEVNDPKQTETYQSNGVVYEEASSVPMLPDKPSEEEGMVYAEVGKGGGRVGYRLKPDESNYAGVKTEGTYYPPCITTDEPPIYTLPSHDYFSNANSSNTDQHGGYNTQNI